MDQKKSNNLQPSLLKTLKTEADLNLLFRAIKKVAVEAVLNAELIEHFGYSKGEPKVGSNACNGLSSKTVLSDEGAIELQTPRDRDGTFEPQLIKNTKSASHKWTTQYSILYSLC